MKSAKNIEKLIRKINVTPDAQMDRKTLDDILVAQEKTQKISSANTRPNVWIIIMKNRITKLAIAAVIIIGLGVTVHLIDRATTSAWAIDQSIEAMKNYRGIYFSGAISMSWKHFFNNLGIRDFSKFSEPQGEFEMWAQADEELSRSSKVKMICPDNIVVSGRKLQAYVQLADGSTYDVQGDVMKIDPWPTSELLKILKEKTSTWTELHGIDAETGKERIFVKCSASDRNKSWQLEFDSESKLLVSLRQWNNSDNYQGLPTIDIWKIVYYEQLPDDMVEINLPDSNAIIAVNTPLYDPNYGMNSEGLTQEQACHKILNEFLQAINEQDFDKIRKLFPYSANWSDEVLKGNLGGDDGPVKLLEMSQIYESGTGSVVPCTVQLKDEKMIIDMIVMFREIDGKSSCVVHSNKDQPRPVE